MQLHPLQSYNWWSGFKHLPSDTLPVLVDGHFECLDRIFFQINISSLQINHLFNLKLLIFLKYIFQVPVKSRHKKLYYISTLYAPICAYTFFWLQVPGLTQLQYKTGLDAWSLGHTGVDYGVVWLGWLECSLLNKMHHNDMRIGCIFDVMQSSIRHVGYCAFPVPEVMERLTSSKPRDQLPACSHSVCSIIIVVLFHFVR